MNTDTELEREREKAQNGEKVGGGAENTVLYYRGRLCQTVRGGTGPHQEPCTERGVHGVQEQGRSKLRLRSSNSIPELLFRKRPSDTSIYL